MYTCMGYIDYRTHVSTKYQYARSINTTAAVLQQTVLTTSCEQSEVCGLDMHDHYQRYTYAFFFFAERDETAVRLV